jgi:hypothetical protein
MPTEDDKKGLPESITPDSTDPPGIAPESEGNGPGELSIVIDDDGNVTLSDLPEELGDLIRELSDDEALISRFCPVPGASDAKPPEKAKED